ncbi:anaerobic ribonucleoside-triphosphate reductase activating protein [Spirochaeta cellobiosiphila]|uniref:anaerobic ribonucleoside-triphosphate reductase activating protein n=1 Tax=Spirochaeta cellobiosiphila TaxID=504483 RepID=UPI0004252F01|nr:anaerobic ribonucleoside-triphosphate reductase activating protein [Spirochaeta cellobiosiphila]
MGITSESILGYLQPSSFIDYPGQISAVLFLPGCNLRCPYCHNHDLLIRPYPEGRITWEELSNFLDKRKKVLSGVTISGGEPSMYPDLKELIHLIKDKGYLVKLDTNGCYPSKLDNIDVDYIALDIKTTQQKQKLMGLSENYDYYDLLQQSIDKIKHQNIFLEMRSVIVPPLLEDDDIRELIPFIRQSDQYYFTKFRPGKCLSRDYGIHNVPSVEMMKKVEMILSDYNISFKIRA